MFRLSELYSFGGGLLAFYKPLSNAIVCHVLVRLTGMPTGTLNFPVFYKSSMF